MPLFSLKPVNFQHIKIEKIFEDRRRNDPAERRNMNKIILSGNLIKNAEIRPVNTKNGQILRAELALAVTRIRGEGSDIWSCIAWDSAAQFIEKGMQDGRYLKGCFVELDGSIEKSPYEENGIKKIHVHAVINRSFSKKQVSEQRYQENQQYQGTNGQIGEGNPQTQGGFTPGTGGYSQTQGGYTPGQQIAEGNPQIQGEFTPGSQVTGGYSQTQGGYTPGQQITESNMQVQGGFTPGRQVTGGHRQTQGGYTPRQQVSEAYPQVRGGFTPGRQVTRAYRQA